VSRHAGYVVSWRKACARAGVVGVTFNDLRGTAVTRLALVKCTEAEAAAITGHSLRDVRSILLAPSPSPCRKRHREARKGNKISQLSAQLSKLF
jgi:hypothetical protein